VLSIARLWYGSRTSCPFYGCCVNLYWSHRFHKVVLGHGYSPERIKMLYLFLIVFPLQSLLCDPNPNSPANSEAARMFSENKREYNRKVREVVEQSWTAD